MRTQLDGLITLGSEISRIHSPKTAFKEGLTLQTAKKLDKSYNIVNGYVLNRQQPRLEVLSHIAEILDIDIKELIVSTK